MATSETDYNTLDEEGESRRQCLKIVVYPFFLQWALIIILTVCAGVACWYTRTDFLGYEEEYHGWEAWHYMFFWEAFALVGAVVAVVNAIIHSIQHFSQSTASSDLHMCCQVIIWVVPVYAVCSAVAFLAEVSDTHFSVLFNALRESYEAVVLVFFMMFISEYLGGLDCLALKVASEEIVIGKVLPAKVKQTLEGSRILDIRPFPARRAPGSEYVFSSFRGVLQYALFIFCNLILHFSVWAAYTRQHEEIPEWVDMMEKGVKGLKLVSNGWALYNLFVLYSYLIEAKHTKTQMEKINPHSKFWCIKLIVLFSLWQENILVFCAGQNWLPEMLGWKKDVVWQSDTPAGQTILADGAVNFLVCLEMVLFAQWHRFAYPYNEDLTSNAEEDSEDRRGVKALGRGLQNLRAKAMKMRRAVKVLRNNPDNEEDLKDAFDTFDHTTQGQVFLAQLTCLLTESEGMTMESARALMKMADTNEDGQLSWDEFRRACGSRKTKTQP